MAVNVYSLVSLILFAFQKNSEIERRDDSNILDARY